VTGTVGAMRRPDAGVLIAVTAVGLTLGLASCSGDPAADTADVCTSADDLRTSLTALEDVQVVAEGTDAVQDAWTTVQDDWSQLADDARDEYADQVDGVEAAAGAVQSAIETTQEEATAQTLAEVATAVGLFLQDAEALVDEVASTC